ncbi:MAG: DUF2786 domain-containing protein [Candidatus Lernaella stagnicola]|nr:DUF2786 domain-containing protein [Candidatus Lernaella stagnicola]
MNREQVMDRVKKLLALGKSCEPYEAALAMEKARALMRRHEIEDGDLNDDGVVREDMTDSFGRLPQWLMILSSAIAQHYDCRAIHYRQQASGKTTVWIVGAAGDVEFAKYALGVVARQLKSSLAEFKKQSRRKLKRWQANDYRLGYAYGVAATLGELKSGAVTDQEAGLVLSKQAAAQQYIDENMDCTKHKVSTVAATSEAGSAGFADGRDVTIQEAMHGPQGGRRLFGEV